MPDIALPRQLHAIGQRAIAEASARHATSVGAEHVLLAIAADAEAPIARSLATAGLGYSSISAALARERARSVDFVGGRLVQAARFDSSPRTTRPVWGASVRDLLRAADRASVKTGIRSGSADALERELVMGILAADLGTVPRMLALLGADRASLVARLRGS